MRIYNIAYVRPFMDLDKPESVCVVGKTLAGALGEASKVLRKRHYIENLNVAKLTVTAGGTVHRVER